jgi:hypothetical protein
MAVEMDGNVRMRGDIGPGVDVIIRAESGRLRVVSGNELIGDWNLADLGINALQEGFNIKVEGEEFVLRTSDDVAFAEELGLTAVSPRLGRLLAARHNPSDPELPPEAPQVPPHLAAIGLAVAGALIVLGGSILSGLGFIAGGVLMIAVAFVMSIGVRVARGIASVVLLALIVAFGFSVSRVEPDTTEITAFGIIAGGLVVAVAVLVSGRLLESE